MPVARAAVQDAASRSPLREGPALTALADRAELVYREEIEGYPRPEIDVARFIDGKELVAKLEFALDRCGVRPAGTVVELGAGTCWLAASLARRPAVERVIAVEFSRRRLDLLAPIALAHLGAPAHKVERVVADFYAPGLPEGRAELVICDAAFHHAADPLRLARVAHTLLRPGGRFVLHREPTLALLRGGRDHGEEGEHGAFEREYRPGGYLRLLREAGFGEARRFPAAGSFASRRARALLHPPLSWLNGIAFSEFTYVGTRT
jgi:SAM-dependent methyltransferase